MINEFELDNELKEKGLLSLDGIRRIRNLKYKIFLIFFRFSKYVTIQ
jgi:hypothetical protein